MKRIKVLQLQHTPDGSTAAVGRRIAENLDPARFDIVTASLTGPARPTADGANTTPALSLELSAWALKGLARWWSVLKLVRLCRAHHFDVLVAHRFKPTHMALMVGRWLGLPVVSVVHAIGDYDRSYRQRLIHKLLKPNDRFVAVSAPVRDYLLSLRCGLTDANTVTINNAIDFARTEAQLLEASSARAALDLPMERFIVGTIGRLVPVKAHASLIEAAQLLVDKHPALLIVIIGEGRERAALEALIEQKGLQAHIRLLGQRDHALRYLRAFDVFALPSRSEGFPLVLLEAMSAQLPVIGSAIPSIASVIGDLGWLHAPDDATQLAACVDQVAALDATARALRGRQLHHHARPRYDIALFRDAYNTLLSDVAATTPHAATDESS